MSAPSAEGHPIHPSRRLAVHHGDHSESHGGHGEAEVLIHRRSRRARRDEPPSAIQKELCHNMTEVPRSYYDKLTPKSAANLYQIRQARGL